MMRNAPFASPIGPFAIDYLAHMRALGRAYDETEWVLRHVDTFLARTNSDLSLTSFAAWSLAETHLRSGVRRNRMRIVRNLCLYRRRTEPRCFLPDITQFPSTHQRIRPHIFANAEILKLVKAADDFRPHPNSPLHREVYRLAIVLLYTAGLRRGELVRLLIGDYEPCEHTLLVRQSKFHKSRMVPLSSDAIHEIEGYLTARRMRGIPTSSETPLLWNRAHGGNGYSGACIGMGIRSLFRGAGIRTGDGRLPRTHDIRHTFAVHALLRWYQSGQDVQAKLPLLSTYMGHVSVVSTQHYLHFVEGTAAQASDRFAKRCGGLVAASFLDQGGAR